MNKKLLFPLLLCLLIVSSCDDEELEAPVPAFITIKDIKVNPTNSLQGSGSDAINDAWVYVGNQLLGVFELPTTVPIQKTGNVKIQVGGGVFNNGLSNDRVVYPLYNFYTLDTFLLPQQELEITPVLNYQDKAVFGEPWTGEDFESGINFEYNPSSDTVFHRETTNNLFEGNAVGLAHLDPNMTFFEAFTPTFSDIPRDGRAVYLELNYFTTHNFAISIYTNDRTQQFSIVNFRPSGGWKKAYVELGPVFSTLFTAYNYNLAIGFKKAIGETGSLYVDNVKIVRF